MNTLDLLEEYLREVNFKRKPYQISILDGSNLYVKHRRDHYYLVISTHGEKVLSQLETFLLVEYTGYLDDDAEPRKWARCKALSGVRDHGSVHDPKLFEKLHRIILKFHNKDLKKWDKFIYNSTNSSTVKLITKISVEDFIDYVHA